MEYNERDGVLNNSTAVTHSGNEGKKAVKTKDSSGNYWIAIAVLLMVIAAVLIGIAVAFGMGKVPDIVETDRPTDVQVVVTPSDTPTEPGNVDVPLQKPVPGDVLTVSQIAEKVNPSVVDITVEGLGSGVGIVYSEDGYILTCAHVLNGGKTVKVTLYPSGRKYNAEIVGYDAVTEVGILKINATGLTVAEFGDPAELKPGDPVVAIGTPYSEILSHTITDGIVSGLRDDLVFEELNLTLDVIQHTATINPGNSGGPLINSRGQVVGMNSIKISGDSYENIGFSIRIDSIREAIAQIIEHGGVNRPVLGIRGYSDESIGGVRVAEVTPGLGADIAGIKAGDIITKVNGRRVYTIEELIRILGTFSENDKVELMILRDVESITVTVTLTSAIGN